MSQGPGDISDRNENSLGCGCLFTLVLAVVSGFLLWAFEPPADGFLGGLLLLLLVIAIFLLVVFFSIVATKPRTETTPTETTPTQSSTSSEQEHREREEQQSQQEAKLRAARLREVEQEPQQQEARPREAKQEPQQQSQQEARLREAEQERQQQEARLRRAEQESLKREQEERRLHELRAMPYKEYLQTPHWKRRREDKLRAVSRRCQLCYSSSGTLDVHHRTYERLGKELDEDLTVLCRECHSTFHKYRRLGR